MQKHGYSIHPSIAIVEKWISEIKAKTGKTLPEWIAIIQSQPILSEQEYRDQLKVEFGLGNNSAGWIVDYALGKDQFGAHPESYLTDAERYVDTMFSGAKSGLLPIYDRLLEMAFSLGSDVKACPCKTIVPLYRTHVFAQLKPSTRTRLDLGLSLHNTPSTTRLIDTGGANKGDRITHRIGISSIQEIDTEVVDYLKKAYDSDSQ